MSQIAMINGIEFNSQGIGKVSLSSNWLTANGRLPVCIAKPPKRVSEIADDTANPSAVIFAQSILARNESGVSRLQTWFTHEAGLLLFPEYAFCSKDFAAIDSCVREHPTRVIVLAGFGAVLAFDLQALIEAGCLPSWQGGVASLVEGGRYNAGWCWIHESQGNTRCFIYVKNFIDQAAEIMEVSNLNTLDSILQVETPDLVLYPLICSDLISTQPNSPRARIERSLPPINKRVIVCTISCNDAPHSRWWRTAIDNVVQMQQQHAVLLFANQPVTSLQTNEDDDRWRCLSGAFISKTRMPKAPRTPLPHQRDISTESAARGLILRDPVEGVAVGFVCWDLSSGNGLYVWEHRMRFAWKNEELLPLNTTVEFYETCRFVARRLEVISSHFPEAARQSVFGYLHTISDESDEKLVTPRLWPELLDGLKMPESPRSADALDPEQDDLDMAFGIFAAVQFATNGQPVLEGPERGQMRWNEVELRVWRSPRLLDRQMLNILQRLALEGGSAPPLIVIGRGKQLGLPVAAQQVEPLAQRARPEKQTDITHAISSSDATFDIESTRLRPVFWQQMAKVEAVLLNPPTDVAQAICEAITHDLDFV